MNDLEMTMFARDYQFAMERCSYRGTNFQFEVFLATRASISKETMAAFKARTGVLERLEASKGLEALCADVAKEIAPILAAVGQQ